MFRFASQHHVKMNTPTTSWLITAGQWSTCLAAVPLQLKDQGTSALATYIECALATYIECVTNWHKEVPTRPFLLDNSTSISVAPILAIHVGGKDHP